MPMTCWFGDNGDELMNRYFRLGSSVRFFFLPLLIPMFRSFLSGKLLMCGRWILARQLPMSLSVTKSNDGVRESSCVQTHDDAAWWNGRVIYVPTAGSGQRETCATNRYDRIKVPAIKSSGIIWGITIRSRPVVVWGISWSGTGRAAGAPTTTAKTTSFTIRPGKSGTKLQNGLRTNAPSTPTVISWCIRHVSDVDVIENSSDSFSFLQEVGLRTLETQQPYAKECKNRFRNWFEYLTLSTSDFFFSRVSITPKECWIRRWLIISTVQSWKQQWHDIPI